MTQYILKKDTFGISAGTIATVFNEDYYTVEEGDLLYRIPAEAVENGSDFEKVEEPKKWARAVVFYMDEKHGAVPEITMETFRSHEAALKRCKFRFCRVSHIIWPARFDDEGYLIMEVEDGKHI